MSSVNKLNFKTHDISICGYVMASLSQILNTKKLFDIPDKKDRLKYEKFRYLLEKAGKLQKTCFLAI